MQSVIRSSELRIKGERRNSEAARVRACRQNVTLMLFGTILLGSFALTNVVLLRSVLQHPMAVGGGEDSAKLIGPLLRERLRAKPGRAAKSQPQRAGGSSALRGSSAGSSSVAVENGTVEAATAFEQEALDVSKEERLKLQKLHEALKSGHHSAAAASGNASQALKQALVGLSSGSPRSS